MQETEHPRERSDRLPQRLPVVAIVGRPNVGKSTFFNRLVGARRALVDSRPGVTRDRNIAPAQWNGHRFLLVDTGGFEDAARSTLAACVRAQSALAAAEADAVIAIFDGREGLNPADRDLVQRLRQLQKPVVYGANKLDTLAGDDSAAEFFALGLTEIFPISSAHGRGVEALMDRLMQQLPAAAVEPSPARTPGHSGAVTLALVGRPNVGKSSLLNRIVGHPRAIVDARPGTTRDPVDTPFSRNDVQYVLIDTAGIRRRPRVHEHLERASVVRALRALERAEVALLLIDATEGMADQDARIAGYAWDRGRALLIVVNKWDTVPPTKRNRRQFLRQIQVQYATLAAAPVVLVSARTGAGVNDLFPALEKLVAAHRRRLRTVQLNAVLAQATQAQAAASVRGRRARFYYATQTATAPPVITIFTNAPALVQSHYERYLASAFRTAFGLYGTPLRLRFRPRPRSQRS